MKLALVLLSAAASALADGSHSPAKRGHHVHVAQIARRNETQDLSKRESYSGVATWYDVTTAAGACGDWMQPGDSVVALNSPQLNQWGGYQNGKPSSCYKSITIQANGVTAGAVIMDECPTCNYGYLDLSMGLFQKFAGLDAGVFQMTWWFNDGSGGDTSGGGSNNGNNNNNNNNQPSSTPDPTPSSTPPPAPTTSDTPTTSSTPSSTSSSSSSSDLSIQSTPSATTYQDNLVAAPKAVVQFAAFLHAAMGR